MRTRRQILMASALCAMVPGIFAQARRVPRVGVLHFGTAKESPAMQRVPFERGLRELGWTPGSTILIEYRYAEGDPSKLRPLADELVRSGVDVIVARANAAIGAARQATSTIPIVTSGYTGDPAADGVANSNARPGGNVTGMMSFFSELDSKRLELLKDAFPKIRSAGVVFNPALDGVHALPRMAELQRRGEAMGIRVHPFEVHRPADIAPAFAAIGKANIDGIVVRGDPAVLDPNHAQITALAAKLRRPAVYWWPFFVEAGGLMSYGDSFFAMHHRAASYVSRILKGEKPGDLPFEAPSKFDLVINLKTAKALGFEIPKSVIFRADRVIE